MPYGARLIGGILEITVNLIQNKLNFDNDIVLWVAYTISQQVVFK